MAFIEIDIQHKLAVRDGFVEVPGLPTFYLTTLTVDEVLVLIPGSVRRRQVHTAKHIIDQEWIELPAFDKADGPTDDYYQILRDAVNA